MSEFYKENDEDFDNEERAHEAKIYLQIVERLNYFQKEGLKYSQEFAHLYTMLNLLKRSDFSRLETYLLDAQGISDFIQSSSALCIKALYCFDLAQNDLMILRLNALLNELMFFSILIGNALDSLNDVDMSYVTERYNTLLCVRDNFSKTWNTIFQKFQPNSTSLH